MDDREETIREHAYRIWESEGRPHGRDIDHWERARRELDTETGEQSTDISPTDGVEPATAPPAADEPPAGPANPAAKPAAAATERRAANKSVRAAGSGSAKR